MSISREHSVCLFVLFLSAGILSLTTADVGTAAHYSTPYLPTECYGRDSSSFPTDNFFVAAGDAVWDNGASCGRQYQVRCLSAANPRACVRDKIILVKVVDYAQTSVSRPSSSGTTMVLSTAAFSAIANISASSVNIEFQQV